LFMSFLARVTKESSKRLCDFVKSVHHYLDPSNPRSDDVDAAITRIDACLGLPYCRFLCDARVTGSGIAKTEMQQ